jgi:tetratricopeptide (TPR) repeat protein
VHLWSSRYDKNLDDIFTIQTEIAEAVTRELRVHLVESEKRQLERTPSENAEAYTLYLKGRFFWNQRTQPSVEKAVEYFQDAIRQDPKMAIAYSALADAYIVLADRGMVPGPDALGKAEKFASKALKIDPDLSQPHAALASIHERNFRWADAEEEFKVAVQANRNNATAHQWYALALFNRGKDESALEEWARAVELDPLSPIIGAGFGYFLVRTGRKEKGFAMLKEVIELNDSFIVAHLLIANAYILAGMKAKAIEEAKKMVALDPELAQTSGVANVYAMAGLKTEAIAILDRLLNRGHEQYTDPFQIAMIYAGLGDEVNALSWMEKAEDEKSGMFSAMRLFSAFDSLRDNPKFREFAEKTGLHWVFQN